MIPESVELHQQNGWKIIVQSQKEKRKRKRLKEIHDSSAKCRNELRENDENRMKNRG